MIEHTKDGKYKLRNANGKAVLHEKYTDAVMLALEIYEKFKKLKQNFKDFGVPWLQILLGDT